MTILERQGPSGWWRGWNVLPRRRFDPRGYFLGGELDHQEMEAASDGRRRNEH